MPQSPNTALKNSSPYSAAITREQFLFFEMRTTAKLKAEGLSDKETVEQYVQILLNMKVKPQPDHAADALAGAITHLNSVQ